MPKMKLTQVAVERARPPEQGRVEIWDTTLPGFGLRIAAPRQGQEARKSWQVMYRVKGRLVRETIGTTATIPDVGDARDLARLSMQTAQKGVNPVAERRRSEEQDQREEARQRDTLSAAIDRYLDRYAVKRMRPDYFKETKRTLDRDVKPALGSRPIREITRRDVRELLEAVVDRGSPSHANHVLAYTRAMLNWAVSNDLIETNPCDGLKMPAPLVERDRALDDDEIRVFWRGCDAIGWPFGPLFKLLLLTGQRRDELAQATRAELDLDKALWTLPRERTKNDKAHVVHLSPLALEILRSLPTIGDKGYLFTTNGERPVSGFGRARERLAVAMGEGIAPFTLHDLRRSAATGMAGTGIAPHVIDRALNHVGAAITGVARIYNRAEYLPERKAALETWAAHVQRLLQPPEENVIALRR